MNEPRWASTREWFEAALDRPPVQRKQWIEHHCRDTRLSRCVLALLEGDDHGDLLDSSIARAMESMGQPEPCVEAESLIGSKVGAFRLISLLGQGGMSTVFLAEREGADFQQRVAVKLLRRGLFSAVEQRLFQRERQTLASLSHPNIARLIDGGITAAGIPYLAMEYVDGLSLTRYAAEHELDLRARLALFSTVCRAVDAAHRSLVVHRDLKPSNILVTEQAQVKLLDFGIAKLLDEEEQDGTRTLCTALTPDYAAPEQFAGGAVTTATDVYSLGVTLHELLLGTRHRFGRMRDHLRSSRRRPSACVADAEIENALPLPARALRAALKGDLDNILLKACASEPRRRYDSAGALADDIDRHLLGQPVDAHPPSRAYRARKFLKRHKTGVIMSSGLLVAILGFCTVALWQAREARLQTHRAQAQAERAETVKNLLVGLFDAQIPQRRRDLMPDTAQLLEQGVLRARALKDKPATQAELLISLGQVYNQLARVNQSKPLLDQAIASARRADPADPALLGAALSERGEADALSSHYRQAIALFDRAIVLQQQAGQTLALATSLDRRGFAYSRSGRHEPAIADHSAAVQIRKHWLKPDDSAVLEAELTLGNAYGRAGRSQESLAVLLPAMQRARARYGDEHALAPRFLSTVGHNLTRLGRYNEAVTALERAIKIEQTIYPEGNADLANSLKSLGFVYITVGRLHDAQRVIERAGDLYRSSGFDAFDLTNVGGHLATIHEFYGERELALSLARQAYAQALDLVGPRHGRTQSLKLQLGRLRLAADPAYAPILQADALDVLAHPQTLGQFGARTLIDARYSLALAQAASGHVDLAEYSLRQAVAELPSDYIDPMLMPSVIALARRLHERGADPEAETLLRGYIGRMQAGFAPTHYMLGEMQLALSEVLAARQPKLARAHLAQARIGLAELPPMQESRRRVEVLQRELNAARH